MAKKKGFQPWKLLGVKKKTFDNEIVPTMIIFLSLLLMYMMIRFSQN